MPDVTVLDVRLHGRSIGTLTRVQGDRTFFAFNQDYIDDPARPTLSLSFKDTLGELITDFRPVQTRLPPFFSNLLPEGAMRDYLAQQARVDPAREFFLLWVLGRDLPGALEIHPADGRSWPGRDDDKAEQAAIAAEQDESVLHFSLAGVQLKFSAVKEATGGLTIPVNGVGGDWIVKLPSTHYKHVPENEFAMMELARRAGIDVPETALIALGKVSGLPKGIERAGSHAFITRRFDRAPNGGQIHIEDFAQVFGVYPDKKYGAASYRNIASVIWTETGERGIAEFIRRFVFNALIGNGDMHLKNWSLIYPDGRHAALAPGYDFVSTISYIPGDKLGLNFLGSKSFEALTLDRFSRFAAKALLPEKLVTDTVQESVQAFADAWRDAKDLAIDGSVRGALESHLKTLPLWKGV
jgi:serine/threonine-protein kinase HipA